MHCRFSPCLVVVTPENTMDCVSEQKRRKNKVFFYFSTPPTITTDTLTTETGAKFCQIHFWAYTVAN